MTEQFQMGLRPKRKPKYRPSDEQDPQNASYQRPNYVKMSVASHTHQYISPSVILNQNAKLLVKFINKANKDIRDVRLMKEESQKELNKKDSFGKDKMNVQPVENTKKVPPVTKTPKTQPPKKTKQLYNFKHQNNQLLKQQILKNGKGMVNQNISCLINNKGIYSGPLSNQLEQLQSLYPKCKNLNYQNLTSPNPNLFQFNQPASKTNENNTSFNQTPQSSVKNSASTQQMTQHVESKPSQTSRNQQSKSTEKYPRKDKVFKRSAYHVAIAYHIYLKNLYEAGVTGGPQIDPTYRARLIKQKAGFNQDQS